jgi:DNA-binding response OmpR family regulator
VLLVSPEPNFARTLERILGRCGYEVSVAECGERAFERALAEPFDLILSQVDLPGSVCGITLLRRIRERGVTVPVVMLTEQDTVRLREHLACCSPAATCLSKDVDVEVLKSTVASCVSRASARAR